MQATSTVTDLQRASQREASMPVVTMGFGSLQSFELMQRGAKLLMSSDLVPKQYQGNLSNCVIALNMANRIGADPLMVMQNLYIVHNSPSWSSKFLIATINTCGRFSSLRYEWRGKPGDDNYGCRAWAIERGTNERLDGIWVDWAMVRAEGWNSRNGSKWKTMPDQMFVYRAAAFWQRAYAPELGMGLQTREEMEDIIDVNADGSYTITSEDLRKAGEIPPRAEVVDGSTGEIDPPLLSYQELLAQIQKAADVDTLAMVMDSARDLPANELAKLQQAYEDRREVLMGA